MSMSHLQPNPGDRPLYCDERGFASIVIALVMIVVLGLLTIGFAQLARREQQNTLDKQLASQAQYAAETGINDISEAILGPTPTITATTTGVNSEDCLGNAVLPHKTISTTNGIAYTCAIVTLDVPTLDYSGVSPNADQTVSFSTIGGGSLSSFKVNWSSADNRPTPRPGGGFTTATVWNSPAVLQFSITPINNKNSFDRNELTNNTFTAFLYPGSGGGSVGYNPGSQGQLVNGNCTATAGCSVTFTGLPAVSVDGLYAVNIINFYDQSNISISNAKDGGGTELKFKDGQAKVDVTGQARNVLKRLQVRIPLTKPNQMATYGIDGQNICKRLQTQPATASSAELTEFFSVGGGPAPAGNPCKLDE